jgi:heme exporter protein C
MSVRWWRTLHQVQSSPSTVAGSYVTSLRLNAVVMLMVTAWFILARYHAAMIERAAAALADEAALGGRRS